MGAAMTIISIIVTVALIGAAIEALRMYFHDDELEDKDHD